jgi:hypothetical protein
MQYHARNTCFKCSAVQYSRFHVAFDANNSEKGPEENTRNDEFCATL